MSGCWTPRNCSVCRTKADLEGNFLECVQVVGSGNRLGKAFNFLSVTLYRSHEMEIVGMMMIVGMNLTALMENVVCG